MREPFLRPFSGGDPTNEFNSRDSWLNRVRENLGQLLIPSHIKASSAFRFGSKADVTFLNFEVHFTPEADIS